MIYIKFGKNINVFKRKEKKLIVLLKMNLKILLKNNKKFYIYINTKIDLWKVL